MPKTFSFGTFVVNNPSWVLLNFGPVVDVVKGAVVNVVDGLLAVVEGADVDDVEEVEEIPKDFGANAWAFCALTSSYENHFYASLPSL